MNLENQILPCAVKIHPMVMASIKQAMAVWALIYGFEPTIKQFTQAAFHSTNVVEGSVTHKEAVKKLSFITPEAKIKRVNIPLPLYHRAHKIRQTAGATFYDSLILYLYAREIVKEALLHHPPSKVLSRVI